MIERLLAMEKWQLIRKQFNLSSEKVLLDHMLLSSHPKHLQDEIQHLRAQLDHSPGQYWLETASNQEHELYSAAAKFLSCDDSLVAFTQSATEGLGLVINGLQFSHDDEILLTDQEHYSSHRSTDFACRRFGAKKVTISLYNDGCELDLQAMISKITAAISSKTRLIIMTWVHSSTGVKLPIREIGQHIQQINTTREEEDRITFLVDGVHGFGVENFEFDDLSCDIFVSSCHKWLFGPRGTGLIGIKKHIKDKILPIIPSYDLFGFEQWRIGQSADQVPLGRSLSPGGFCAFEHRWALKKAFEWHEEIGRQWIQERSHFLCSIIKNGLSKIEKVTLMTPNSEQYSSALVCFKLDSWSAADVIQRLADLGVVGTVTPYRRSYARFSPAVYNSAEDCERAVWAVQKALAN